MFHSDEEKATYDQDAGADVFVRGEFSASTVAPSFFILPLLPLLCATLGPIYLPFLLGSLPRVRTRFTDFILFFLSPSSRTPEVPSHDAASSSWVDRMKVKGDWLEQKIVRMVSIQR